MPKTESPTPTISQYLDEPLRVGEPDLAGPLTVFPIFGPAPQLEYVAFAQGRTAGVIIKELESGPSVRDLVVDNPTRTAVLLYEGEEVLGAQQNRNFDTSVLIPAGERLQVPVSCMEAGRWDASRHAEEFRPAPQAADPTLRRQKARQAQESLAAGAGPAPTRAQSGTRSTSVTCGRGQYRRVAPCTTCTSFGGMTWPS